MKNTMLWTRCFSFIWFVSISRVLFSSFRQSDRYLSRSEVTIGLERFRLWPKPENTILHTCKDLAVSPLLLPIGFILIYIRMSDPFGPRRLCSHLGYCYRWVLPTTLPASSTDMCPDFPHPSLTLGAHLSDTNLYA